MIKKLKKLFIYNRHSIKIQMAFWYTGLTIAIVILFLATMFYINSYIIRDSVHYRLKKSVEHTLKKIEVINGSLVVDGSIDVPIDDIYISIYDKNHEFVYGNSKLEEENPEIFQDENEFFENAFYNDKVRTIKLKSYYSSLGKNSNTENNFKWYIYEKKENIPTLGEIWIRGMTPASTVEENIERITLIFIMIFPFLVIVSGLVGYLITNKAFKPIEKITNTVEEINEGNDLSKRINIGNKEKNEIYILANIFDQMFDRLQKSFEREERFTSDVSHELRTPISIINSQSEYSLKYLEPTGEIKESFENILEESQKMSKMVSQLLMLARMEKGTQKLNLEKVNLYEIVELSIGSLENKAEDKNIKIINNIDENIFVEVDETMITRLFINLISNGITYGNENGEIKIEIIEKNNEKILCKVEDNGIGIAKENLDKIWERFYQVDSSRSGENSGLGLSMVKWIVEEHKGKIKVESKLGKGTAFIFQLPKGRINEK